MTCLQGIVLRTCGVPDSSPGLTTSISNKKDSGDGISEYGVFLWGCK